MSTERTGRPASPKPRNVETGGQRPLPATVVGLGLPDRPLRREMAPQGALIIGRGIKFRGDIEACEHLLVEGDVEASVQAKTLEVTDKGHFDGRAVVASAEIAGTFEGTLIVTSNLRIKSTGRVTGEVRYRRLAIEDGGVLSGDVERREDPAGEEGPSREDHGVTAEPALRARRIETVFG